MTYEQGGGSRGGRAIALPTGDTLTLYDRVAHHRATSLSTVEIASREADRLTVEFANYFANATRNPQGQYKTYVISGSNSPGKLRALTTLLDRNGIQYSRATSERDYEGYDYTTGQSGKTRAAAGDLIISAYQPRAVLTPGALRPLGGGGGFGDLRHHGLVAAGCLRAADLRQHRPARPGHRALRAACLHRSAGGGRHCHLPTPLPYPGRG